MKDKLLLLATGLIVGFLSLPVEAENGNAVIKVAAPVELKHTCQIAYEGCNAGCKITPKGGCVEECAADCNVCALDFGEETQAVCRR